MKYKRLTPVKLGNLIIYGRIGMDEQLITYVLSNISFGVLFVWLLFDTRKDSKEREKKYQETIDKLADKMAIVIEIRDDVEEVKEKIKNLEG